MYWDNDEQDYQKRGGNASTNSRYSSADRYERRNAPSTGSADSRSRQGHSVSGSRFDDRGSYKSRTDFSERSANVAGSGLIDRSSYESRSGFEGRDSYGSRSIPSFSRDDSDRGEYSRRYGETPVRRSTNAGDVRGASRSSDSTRPSGSRNASGQRPNSASPRAAAPSRSSANAGRGAAPNRSAATAKRSAASNKRPSPKAARRGRNSKWIALLAAIWEVIVALFQSVNADVSGRRKRQLLPALYLPLACIYSELLLSLFNGLGLSGFFYKLFFGLSTGMLLGGVALFFRGRVQKIIVRVELFLIGLLFIVQCLIRKEFQVYFPLRTVFGNVTGVMGNYSSDLFSSILRGIPAILLFFLPLGLYWFMTARSRRRSFVVRVRSVFAFELILVSLLSWSLGKLSLAIGGESSSYSTDFEITSSSDTFGLLTGFRLSEKYALFGDNASDSFDDLEILAPVETAAVETPDPTQESPEAQETQQLAPTATPLPYGYNTLGFDFTAMNEGETDEYIIAINKYLSTQTASSQNAYTGLF